MSATSATSSIEWRHDIDRVLDDAKSQHRPVLLDFSERRFSVIADKSPVETTVRLYLCRDRLETLTKVLSPHSLVVLGGRKRWWPTSEKRLAGKLRRAGHEVILAETE